MNTPRKAVARPRRNLLLQSKTASVAVLFAVAAVPTIALVGLAIDYATYDKDAALLAVAANTAALNAARVAANAEVSGQTAAQAKSAGNVAGLAWFNAVAGQQQNENVTPTVDTEVTTGVTATVSYTGTVASVFGKIYNKTSYPIRGAAAATVTLAPYLDLEIMMDNSSSMQQGATATDIENMDYWSACNSYIAWENTTNNASNPNDPTNGQGGDQFQGQTWWTYKHYTTTFNGNDGQNGTTADPGGASTYNTSAPNAVPYPVPINAPNSGTGPDSGYGLSAFPATTSATQHGGPICKGFASLLPTPKAGATPIRAGEPCAFACHYDGSKPAGQGTDLYALARSTIGTKHPVTLRFDVVKLATNAIIQAMQKDDLTSIRNLNVGVFAFNDVLTQVYPAAGSTCSNGAPTGEACDDWTTAINNVGLPPTTANGADTGIQAELLVGGALHYDTAFTATMTQLQQTYLKSPSGSGVSPSSPRKVLFLITDGIDENDTAQTHTAFDPAQCTTFKNMGYTIYVAYTPYAPYPDFWYQQVKSIVEGTGAGSVSYALQQCATDPANDYIVASNLTQLNAALATFLKAALNQPARFTQ